MNHSLIYDGVDIGDFHAHIFQQNVYDAPAREYTRIDIPGRNGQLLIDEGRYPNVSVEYAAVMVDNFRHHIDRLRNFLLTRVGYKRLEDTYHPDEFYQAVYTGMIEVTTTAQTDKGKFIMSFERKPQRWLKSGEETHVCEGNLTLVNPELTIAKPLIRVYGQGTLTINGNEITVAYPTGQNPEYIDIDSDIEDVYKGTENHNNAVTLPDHNFPVLLPGENEITCDGLTCEIIPRWWRL